MNFAFSITACALNAAAGTYVASLALSAAFAGRFAIASILGSAAVAAVLVALWMGGRAKHEVAQ